MIDEQVLKDSGVADDPRIIHLMDAEELYETLVAALAVVRAAQAVYRGPHRLSKELAPLEYALFASLEPFQAKEEK